MIFKKTKLNDAWIIDFNKLEDNRGFFARSFCKNEFSEHGLNPEVVQANVSYNNKKHTLRGLHYQAKPYGETKLVRCTKGAIYDVIIDVRSESSTFKQWIGVELNEDNHRMLYVPEGFAHGFITLDNETEVMYMVSEYYTPDSEKGIRWNDPEFNIQWPVEPEEMSEKDKNWTDFSSA